MQGERERFGRESGRTVPAPKEIKLSEAAQQADVTEEGGQRPWLVLAMLSVGVILAALDLTVVVAILTTMMNDLNVTLFDIDQGAWIVSAYLLA